MTRYRIIQQPRFTNPRKPHYLVEKRVWFWWEYAGLFSRLEEAEERVRQLQEIDELGPIRREVVREYK